LTCGALAGHHPVPHIGCEEAHVTRTKRSRRLLRHAFLGVAVATLAAGCGVSREQGIGRSLAEYDYVVLRPKDTHEYHAAAMSILDQSFVALEEGDPRLDIPRVRRKACMVDIDYVRGFWSSSGWVDVLDHDTRSLVMSSRVRNGMFWTGANEDVMAAIRDVAAARAAGPALPDDARTITAAAEDQVPRPKSIRLQELNDLRKRQLISEGEYSRRRQSILDEP
jgi:hypothetical protein